MEQRGVVGRHPVALVAILTVAVGLGRLGLIQAELSGASGVGAVWLPAGFAVAILLLAGRSVWPALALAALLVYLSTPLPVATAFALTASDTLAVVLLSALVERGGGGADAFRRPRTIFRFVVVASLVTAAAAAFGVAVTAFSGGLPWSEWRHAWMTWWLGHLTGVLVVTPFVLLWVATPLSRPDWRAAAEGLALGAALVVTCLVAFGGVHPSDVKTYPLQFFCVPLLLWTAFRFGRREVATAVAVITATAIWGTMHGLGPFAQGTPHEAAVLLQAYVGMMAVTGAVLAAALAEQREAEAKLQALATTDPLTGLANYRHLLDVLRMEIARSGRTGRPFALLLVDMNGLKAINDRYGHLIGSRSICRVADVLRQSCRVTDTPARFGGDEFALVLPETDAEGGRRVLERISRKLAEDRVKPAVTVSGGVAGYPHHGESATMLLRAADRALYLSKVRRSAALLEPPEPVRRTGA